MGRALALSIALMLSACAGEGGPAVDVPSEVTGRIVGIEGHARIRAFVVESEGERYRVLIDSAHDYGFDLGHLREHHSQRQPVLVRTEVRGGRVYATAIEDA